MSCRKFSAVFVLFLSIGIGECSDDLEMWDRFKVWFHSLDHNGDEILSSDDTVHCTERHANHALNPETVRAKCEELLPRWFHFFVLRQSESVTEDQFIESFKNLRNQDEETFNKVIVNAGKLFWRIVDMNNDGIITVEEDSCVDREYDRDDLADDFAKYLLNGRLLEDIEDIFCPWIF